MCQSYHQQRLVVIIVFNNEAALQELLEDFL